MKSLSLKDYYLLLNIKKAASDAEIKKAYRKLALQHHPDMSRGAEAEEKFKSINEAYSVLSDSVKRRHYDLYGTVPKGGSNGSCPFSNREWAGGTGFGSGTGRRCGCGRGLGIIGWWNVAFRNSDQNVFQEGNNFVCKIFLTSDEIKNGSERFVMVNDYSGLKTFKVIIPPASKYGQRIVVAENSEYSTMKIFMELQES